MLSKEIAYLYVDSVDRVISRVNKNHPVSDSENHHAYVALICAVRRAMTTLEAENNKHAPHCPECGGLV